MTRAIISGKRYDTEKAEAVADHDAPYNCSDFHWCSETLYRTPKGSWFVSGQGNAMSPYSEACPDGRGPGSAIRPLTAHDARELLERWGETEALEQHFAGEVEDA
jgi:hypothetical protein